MVSVSKFNVHYGMSEEFVHVIGKIHEAIGKTDWGVQYVWVAGECGRLPSCLQDYCPDGSQI